MALNSGAYTINFIGTPISFSEFTFTNDNPLYEFINCLSQLPQLKAIVIGSTDSRITETCLSTFRDDHVAMIDGKPVRLEQLNLLQIAGKLKSFVMKHPVYGLGLYFVEVFSSKTNLSDATRVITITRTNDIKIHINQN